MAKTWAVDGQEGDHGLAQDLLDRMSASKADFTLTFRHLCDASADQGSDGGALAFEAGKRPQGPEERRNAVRRVNPAFIPRNHRLEAVIKAAVDHQDFTPFHELMMVLSNPYQDQPNYAAYAYPPLPEEQVLRTFCGT